MGLFGDRIKSAKGAVLGQQGEHYMAGDFNSLANQLLDQEMQAMADQGLNRDLGSYALGNRDLASILGQYGSSAGSMSQLALSPVSGRRLASDQVATDPILGAVFGSGGAMDRAFDEENALATTGYSLKNEDHDAYGQASDEIARMFGQQEQSLAQALASRGLAAGGGGAVNQQFANLYGNKSEQLAKAQKDIAQRRMEMNLQRLGQVRQYAAGLSGQANQAISGQQDANRAGVQQRQGMMQDKANFDLNRWSGEQSALAKQAESKANAYVPGFFDSVHAGANKGAGNFANSFMSGGFMGKKG